MGTIRPGVLSTRQLIALAKAGVIAGVTDPVNAAGASAIDLTLAEEGWRLRGSIKGRSDRSYNEVLSNAHFLENRLDLSKPIRLEPGSTYVIRLRESLYLDDHPDLFGYASAKSSIGRLDMLVRLVADYAAGYDEVLPRKVSGRWRVSLYAEVTPISFPVIVSAGVTLNQLRLYQGDMRLSELTPEELQLYGDVLTGPHGGDTDSGSVSELTVDISPVKGGDCEGLIGFEALQDVGEPIDLTRSGILHDPKRYWTPVIPDTDAGDTLKIVPERFYILRSRERFALPPDTAAFVHAVTEQLGELRIHYAGFVHPGFGYGRPGGTPLIFETRGHNIVTFLRQSEQMAKIRYFRMSEPVDLDLIAPDNYQNQELNLSKYFGAWK
jgi:dCTP deaminase